MRLARKKRGKKPHLPEKLQKTGPLETGLMKMLTLEEGIRETVRRIKEVEDDGPLFIAVYGVGNSGKTFLIERLKKEFERIGLEPLGFSGTAGTSAFDTIKLNESLGSCMTGQGKKPKRRVYIFHCPWTIMLGKKDPYDPNHLTKKFLGKPVHLNIGIYNPDMGKFGFSGEFDFFIRNPDSKMKRGFMTCFY